MHYTIDFDNRADYLFAHVRGQDSVANSLDYWTRLRAACEQYGQHKVLVIDELHNPPDQQDLYAVATTIPTLFLNYPVKIAYVAPNETPEQRDLAVGITRKRGLEIKVFDREDEAMHWLCKE